MGNRTISADVGTESEYGFRSGPLGTRFTFSEARNPSGSLKKSINCMKKMPKILLYL